MNASDIMTSEVRSLGRDDSVSEAARLMYAHDIRHVPVTDGDRLVGVVSDRDIREVLWADADAGTSRRRGSTSLSEVMRTDIISVDTTASVAEVVDIMLEHKVGAVMVVDTDESLAGVISYVDVLEAVQDKLS